MGLSQALGTYDLSESSSSLIPSTSINSASSKRLLTLEDLTITPEKSKLNESRLDSLMFSPSPESKFLISRKQLTSKSIEENFKEL